MNARTIAVEAAASRKAGVPRRALLHACAAALLARPWATARAQAEPQGESLLKASFLHKFASFVDWPDGTFASADAPLRIGVLGDDQVYRELRDLAQDRDRDGRPVQVVRLAAGEPLTGYHILYLKAATPERIAELLALVPEAVLTVSDSDGAQPGGSVISFYLEDGQVHFGASVDAAARQRLRLSPRLLAAARVVRGPLPGGARTA